MFNDDVATGKNPAAGFSTTGPDTAFTKSEVPPATGLPPCYLWDVLETCTETQKQILKNGTAIVENFILVGYKRPSGSDVFFNGTSIGNNDDGSALLGSGKTASSAASSITAYGTMKTSLFLMAAFMGVQAALV
jgi:hypothetical protein